MQVLKTLKTQSLIQPKEKIGAAVSGGSDSVALLHFLSVRQKELRITLCCINVEHGIRGESSKKDSLFVKELCESLGIEFYCYTVDATKFSKEHKISLELAARTLRYGVFQEAIASNVCDKIATAHNLSDNAETVLLNLFRGSGNRGMGGISYQIGNIIRPLLDTPKAEILEYLKENNLSYVTDESNLDTAFTRNYIRHEVLPVVKKRFEGVEKALTRFAQNAREDESLLEELSQKLLSCKNGECFVSFLNQPKSLVKRAAVLALEKLGERTDIEFTHLESLITLAFEGENGGTLDFPSGIKVQRNYEFLAFFKEIPQNLAEIPFAVGKLSFGQWEIHSGLTSVFSPQKGFLCLDYDTVKDAVVRTVREGDIFKPYKGKTKKLCDYFTDKKIPRRLRNNIPLLCDNSEVLAVLGLEISDRVKVTAKTEKILNIILKEKEHEQGH